MPDAPASAAPPPLPPSWQAEVGAELDAPYMAALRTFLRAEEQCGPVFPPSAEVFSAFHLTPFDKVRVVVLGQDPYHGPGQAHGLAFSVRRGVPVPPSLANIYKELRTDLGVAPPAHGELVAWAEQGVLLLNTTLTVRPHEANSHRGQGWETFTDRVVEVLGERREGLVFVLWGRPAAQKAARIDRDRHHVITSPHPSPLSARGGFFGSRPFSRVNAWLSGRGEPEIDWRLPA
jgi:uracil-DNA glycosylase